MNIMIRTKAKLCKNQETRKFLTKRKLDKKQKASKETKRKVIF